mgnify:FL=1|jgi:hypothetical protein
MYTNLIITFITMHKSMPKFYDYNGQKYSICFPIEWATNHFEKTGPHECINCLHYGCTDDVFTSYCINCQEYEYNFTRVPGNNNSINQYNFELNSIDDYDNISDISENETFLDISSVMPIHIPYVRTVDVLSSTTSSTTSYDYSDLYDSNYEYDDNLF